MNEQVNLYNSPLIFSQISSQIRYYITFNVQDPPWLKENIKAKIELKIGCTRNTNGLPEALYYLMQNLSVKFLLISRNTKLILYMSC